MLSVATCDINVKVTTWIGHRALYVIDFITLLYYNQPLCIAENYYYIVVVG